ncbi:MAG: hypothetical protein RBT46_07060 [Weeksellaceae bacterium]|jgi:cytochrome c biogenesis protein CcdA|nr:hypothetical protein [Weeksellaceae bacterium]MDX9705451.1 hypothetical protein [Weeksellaceae bacterium]
MKLPQGLITGLVFFVLGIAAIIIGVLLKLNHYADGWITGNNIILLGMFLELLGIFFFGSSLLKTLNKKK